MLSLTFPYTHSPFHSIRSAKPNTLITVSKNGNINVEKNQIFQPELMPKHVAILIDGSRRWANKRGLSVNEGQLAGAEKVKEITYLCIKYGIKVFTWFAFSTGSEFPSNEEVDFLMEQYEGPAMAEMESLQRYNVRCSFIGDTSLLPKSFQNLLALIEDATKNNSGLHVIGALNYSGRHDITQACKSVATKLQNGLLQLEDINDSTFEYELETKCTDFPSPDLFIRTSGEHRVSNVMLWQMAYSELFVTDRLFPDFEEEDFVEALKSFQKRDRRYGGKK